MSSYEALKELAQVQSEELFRKDVEIALWKEKVKLLEKKVKLLERSKNE